MIQHISNPSIEDISNIINTSPYFSLIRFTCDWWKMANFGLQTMPKGKIPKDLFSASDKFLMDWVNGMIKGWEKRVRGNRRWGIDPKVYFDLIKFCLQRPVPDNMMIGASPKPMMGPWETDPHLKVEQNATIKMIISQNHLWHPAIWRRYACTGDIDILLQRFKNEKIVVVGPWYYANFDKKSKLPNYTHIEIDRNNAILHAEKTKLEIEKQHKEFKKDFNKVIYICCGGPAISWPIINLHGKLENAYMLDAGYAPSMYYFDDNVRRTSPHYYWGAWMDVFPPLWWLHKNKNFTWRSLRPPNPDWVKWNRKHNKNIPSNSPVFKLFK